MRVSNCIGFAYHELGITAEEHVCDCPTEEELYEKFDPVDENSPADAVAVIAPLNGEMAVIHIALFNGSKDFIVHRRGGSEPISEPFTEGLENYLRDYEPSRLVFLALKDK